MNAIKKARKFIESNSTDPASITLAGLILSLESESPFAIAELYKLDYDKFELAMEIVAEWRLDRYYAGKGLLLNVAMSSPQAMGQSSARN